MKLSDIREDMNIVIFLSPIRLSIKLFDTFKSDHKHWVGTFYFVPVADEKTKGLTWDGPLLDKVVELTDFSIENLHRYGAEMLVLADLMKLPLEHWLRHAKTGDGAFEVDHLVPLKTVDTVK